MSRSRSREKEAASTTTASEQREEATARAGHAVKGATRARARQATGAVSRIATMQAHQHAVGGAAKSQFTPGMLVVKCKEDVVANVPEIQTASVASIRSFSLPK